MIPGFVRVSVTGEQCERFLNLCRGRDMELRKIIRTGEKEFHVTLKVKDFWKISPLRRKTGVHIHILRKKGPVFWLLAANRHKLILAGLLSSVIFKIPETSSCPFSTESPSFTRGVPLRVMIFSTVPSTSEGNSHRTGCKKTGSSEIL